MEERKRFRRTLKLIVGSFLLVLILSELFAVLETLGIGSRLVNGVVAIVLIVVSIAATFAGYYILTRRLLKPLSEMDAAAIELAGGNLNIDIQYRSEDEMGYLAESFRNLITEANPIINDMTPIIQ